MGKLSSIIKAGASFVTEAEKHISENKDIQKMLFGTYSNGSPRNLADAISGEVVSPEDKLKITKRLEKNEKKKKKRKKKGKKYAKIDLSKLAFSEEIKNDNED